jgi:hypothetical protein
MGKIMEGRMLSGDSTKKCSRCESTAELDGGILEVNVRGCD